MAMRASVVVMVWLLGACVAAQAPAPPIRNFLRINDQFCTGGQPRLEHFAQLKAEGVKELGMRYFNIPVVFGNPTDEQATEFLRLTDDPANRPAFIHCTAAIRVGAFWMIRRALRDGFTIEAAEKDAETVGLHDSPHLNRFARDYIAKVQAAK